MKNSYKRLSRYRIALIALLAGTLAFGCVKSGQESGKVLRLAHPEKIRGLDPIHSDDVYAADEVARAYESLLQYHYLKRPYTLVPNLAEAMPEISADGKTYVIRLKKGVLFHDDRCFKQSDGKGREMTADDVIYSIKRLVDPKLRSTGAWLVDGKIEGLTAWHDAAVKAGTSDYSQPVAGLAALDRHTVRIRLTQRFPSFLYSLAMPFTAVVPHEAVDFYGKEFQNHAVGTGPFRLEAFSPGKQVWVRNPTYRQELYPSEGAPGDREAGLLADAGKPIPFVDKVVVEIFEQWQPAWLNFLSGRLDRTAVPKDGYAQAITPGRELSPELKAKGFGLHKYPLLDVVHVIFNMSDPIIGKNKYLRQALSLVFDSRRFSDLFFNGWAIPAQSPIPPGLEGFDPEFKNRHAQFNLEKARQLLAKAGYPEGKGLPPLLLVSTPPSKHHTEFAVQAFKQLGVQLNVELYSWPEFQNSLRTRKGQLWNYAWNADYPDPENFLQLFYGKNISPGPNSAGYVNAAYDRLYERLIAISAGKERSDLIRKMVAMIEEDCPWIFAVHRMGLHLTNPAFVNYKPSAFYGTGNAKYYRIQRKP